MPRRTLLWGLLAALLSSRSVIAQAPVQAPPSGLTGGTAALWVGIGLLEHGFQTGWRRPARAAGPAIRTASYDHNDGATVDSLVAALYGCLSHGPSTEPDWSRMARLFLPSGTITPPKSRDRNFSVMSVEGFRDLVRQAIPTRGNHRLSNFLQEEVARRTTCFGNVCNVFSTFESRRDASDGVPLARGINSLQLVHDGDRWWIAAETWEIEGPGNSNPIPPEYLPATIPAEYRRTN